MRILAVAMVLLFAGATMAGCTGGPDDSGDDPNQGTGDPALVPIPAFPIEVDHDHSDPTLHSDAANLDQVAYHSTYGEGDVDAIPAGQGFSELFLRGHLAFIGRRGGNDGGFVILDVERPQAPQKLGEFAGLANYDMESTYDNRYVFFVSQFLNNQQPSSFPPDDPGELPRQIHIVDIADPASPEWVGAMAVPSRGVHTITYHRTEQGRELVVAQTYDFVPDPSLGLPLPDQGTNMVAQRVLLFDFVREPTPTLQLLSTYEKHPTETETAREAFPHDVFIQEHPVTHDLLMYVAYWDLGGFIVDITDPTTPADVAHLTDFSPSSITQVHLLRASAQLIDGRHITIAEPELTQAETETGQYTLFDTTDPANPKRLGFWTLPGEVQNDQGTRFSPHNFDIENGRVYLAHYHAGVWILDISTQALQDHPVPLAYAQPSQPRPDYDNDISDVWTALHHEGYVYASDIATGFYVYRFPLDPEPHMH